MSDSPNVGKSERRDAPLAIVGISALFPGSEGLEPFWQNLQKGKDSIRDVPEEYWDAQAYLHDDPKARDMLYAAKGGFLDPIDFDPLAYGLAPRDIQATDTAQILGLVGAKRALDDAGYGPGGKEFDRSRTSVILGVTGSLGLVIPLGARLGHPLWRKALKQSGVPDDVADDVVERISDGYVDWQENSFPGLLGNVVAGRIANRLDLQGTNCVVDAACASSLSALHLAAMELQTGRADTVVTGGVDTFNDVFMFMCFSKTTALSPTGSAKPFDKKSDGTILGEGVGIVVLKRLEDAERDGDRIYAVLRGIGSSSDGKGQAIYAPAASGQARALRRAYAAADISPATVEMVEAHGTGTRVGDTTEVAALSEVYRESGRKGRWAAVGSVKSQIGHTKAAAGVASLVKTALALYHKVVPPTIRVDDPIDPIAVEDSPFYLPTEKRPWLRRQEHPRRAALSAFGFGGSNFHAVLEEHAPTKPGIDWDPDVEMLPFQAQTVRDLETAVAAWPGDLSWDELSRRAAAARETFDVLSPCRLVLVIERGRTDIAKQLANAVSMLHRDPHVRSWSTPDGAHFGQGQLLGKLAMLFPGQGSQYVGMLRDLACRFPVVQNVLEKADVAYEMAAGGVVGGVTVGLHLSDRIFPYPAFNDAMRATAERLLRDTRVAQPAIGAVSLGALAVLGAVFGVGSTAFAGHSYGELAALEAGGAFDAQTLQHLSVLRGQLMADGDGDRGAMLALRTDRDAAVRLVDDGGLKLAIANHNAPEQVVLSGATDEIERAVALSEARGVTAKRLRVAAAFHSPLVDGASEPLRAALDRYAMDAPKLTVYANASAEPYPGDAAEARDLLAHQLGSPVEFVAMIERMYADGVRTFVEVGPGATLSRLVGAILDGRDHAVVAVDASSGRRNGMSDLAACLAQIAVQGHSVDIAAWNAGVAPPAPSGKRRMSVPISGANAKPKRVERPSLPLLVHAQDAAARGSGAAPLRPTNTSPPPAALPPAAATRPAPDPVASMTSFPRDTVPPAASPPGVPTPPPRVAVEGASSALAAVREQMETLLRLSTQTAELHRRFLESQDTAQRTIEVLLDQQRALMGLAPSGEPAAVVPPRAPAARPLAAPPVRAVPAPAPFASPDPESSPAPAPAPSPAPATAAPTADLTAMMLDVVADKTGYPVEMLEPSMEMDADLGIDSIKRVEILAAMQERVPGLPAVASDELGRLRTLADVVAILAVSVPSLVAAPVAATSPSAPAPAADLTAIVLDVVAEKTGYPVEMLEPSMEMDADLGIDSIKRVEILAAMQERVPGLPAVASDELGRLRTLADVVAILAPSAPVAAPPVAAKPASEVTPEESATGLTATLLEVVAEKTGYPVDMLEPSMEMDADLGIDSIKRVEILAAMQERVPGLPAVASDQLGSLRTLADIVAALGAVGRSPPVSAPAPTPASSGIARPPVDRHVLSPVAMNGAPRAAVEMGGGEILVAGDPGGLGAAVASAFVAGGRAARAIAIDASDVPADIAGVVLVSPPTGADSAFLRDALALLVRTGGALRAAGGALLVTVSRLDGSFGLAELNGAEPASGGLAGFAKTAAHEWPEVACKALDVPSHVDDLDAAARAIVEESLLAGPLEVGLPGRDRIRLALESTPLTGTGEPPFEDGDLIVVTGGARGVTAASAVALAAAFRPALLLLGRSPEPADEPAWLDGLTTAAEIKRALASQLNGGSSPRAIEAEYRRIVGARAIRDTLAQCAAAGGTALYRSVDVRDADAVLAVVETARAEHGPVRGVVHGAGVLRDALIEQKTPEQFDDVYGTKVDGLRAVLSAAGDDDVRAIVLFSSSTGRFGRSGQVDYAAANEVLNKIAQREARRRPACRVVSVNWGPWAGGMVTDAHKRLFADEGIGLIGLDEGAEYLVRELSAGAGAPVEVVVLGPGSRAPEAPLSRRSDAAAAPTTALPLACEREISAASHPYLRSHVLDGRPVVPVVHMLELLGHGALHAHPGLRFHGVEAFRMLNGITLTGASATVRIHVGKLQRRDGAYHVPVELRGTDERGRERLHAKAEVVLADRLPMASGGARFAPSDAPLATPRDTIYAEQLFHGPDLQGLRAVPHLSDEGVVVTSDTAPAPTVWIAEPLRSTWLADPLAIDVAFQALVVWTRAHRGAPSLPTGFAHYRQYAARFPQAGVRISARVTGGSEHATRADLDFTAEDGTLVARMEGYECVVDASLEAAYSRRTLAGSATA